MEENKVENVPQEGEFKMKKKPGRPKKLTNNKTETPKIEFKKEQDAVQEPKAEETVLQSNEEKEEQVVELQEVGQTHEEKSPAQESEKIENSVISEVTEEETKKDPIVTQSELNLPENVEKLVKFMQDTGGNINDYVRLNADYTNVSEDVLLQEYYKN